MQPNKTQNLIRNFRAKYRDSSKDSCSSGLRIKDRRGGLDESGALDIDNVDLSPSAGKLNLDRYNSTIEKFNSTLSNPRSRDKVVEDLRKRKY